MPRICLALGIQNTCKVGGSTPPTPTAVLISGAGTESCDGNYVWDGVTIVNGKPSYFGPEIDGGNFRIDWNGSSDWVLSIGGGDPFYLSSNLINWTQGDNGENPPPTGTLSYS
jgi:hypothetical protein